MSMFELLWLTLKKVQQYWSIVYLILMQTFKMDQSKHLKNACSSLLTAKDDKGEQ